MQLVYHSDVLVGAVACRVESKKKPATENENSEKKDDAQKDKTNSSTNTKPMKRVYVMTLGVLPVYRRYGIGRRMLEKVIDAVEKSEDLDEIYLNMQVNNEEALGFYKNFGFDVVQRIPGYYKRIEPSDCFEVARFFNKNKDSAKAGGKAAAADVEAKGDATKAASKWIQQMNKWTRNKTNNISYFTRIGRSRRKR